MKINNHKKFKIELEKIKEEKIKPSLLLHSCCAPCGTYPILLLNEYFDLTVFYNNSNIYPYEEYKKRLNETINYISKLNKETNSKIKLIAPGYENKKINKVLQVRSNDPEGSRRCSICYTLRFKQLVEYAKENNYDYVCSAMTISRHKDEQLINKILSSYANKNGVNYLYSNFKKEQGLEKAQKISKENNMYHQDYCGCVFSLKEKTKKRES